MKTLGIDYGRGKIGLAIGEGTLAEPIKVVRVDSFEDALQKIKKEVDLEKPDKIVVGVSEGEMGEESKEFAMALDATTFDETLTSKDAQKLSIEAGVKRKKRKEMEDAYAAALMLQSYLDSLEP